MEKTLTKKIVSSLMPLLNSLNKSVDKYENEKIVTLYKEFMGESELKNLLEIFTLSEFTRCWDLVLTSPSTEFLGTGVDYTSVKACYILENENSNNVTLINSGFNEKLEKTYIEGISEPRDIDIPTCRTVQFNSLSKFTPKGDYWITYYKKYCLQGQNLKVLIVVAPLIIPYLGISITPNFGFYTLVSSDNGDAHKLFWENKNIIKDTLEYLEKKGFDKLWSKPVPSLKSINYEDQRKDAILIDSSNN